MPGTAATLPGDHFARPSVDLDDTAARIAAALAYADERTAGRAIPDALADELRFAAATLADLKAIIGPFARHKAFRDEHGIETLKGLWFAFADHPDALAEQRIVRAGAGRTHRARGASVDLSDAWVSGFLAATA